MPQTGGHTQLSSQLEMSGHLQFAYRQDLQVKSFFMNRQIRNQMQIILASTKVIMPIPKSLMNSLIPIKLVKGAAQRTQAVGSI
ncbi:hypothetical protein ED236_06465 [Pseudomethylobacillus aquaticus]|uniref:Uncharacterized protein n=1 Tax=Pseudomethylobacillus aquaticus TaxID=2676064 RepID=A0A3N0V077_9PROT|nr:hypothetical protein ED236_06465 [Pseudomethylobacillus aquaticus]